MWHFQQRELENRKNQHIILWPNELEKNLKGNRTQQCNVTLLCANHQNSHFSLSSLYFSHNKQALSQNYFILISVYGENVQIIFKKKSMEVIDRISWNHARKKSFISHSHLGCKTSLRSSIQTSMHPYMPTKPWPSVLHPHGS